MRARMMHAFPSESPLTRFKLNHHRSPDDDARHRCLRAFLSLIIDITFVSSVCSVLISRSSESRRAGKVPSSFAQLLRLIILFAERESLKFLSVLRIDAKLLDYSTGPQLRSAWRSRSSNLNKKIFASSGDRDRVLIERSRDRITLALALPRRQLLPSACGASTIVFLLLRWPISA